MTVVLQNNSGSKKLYAGKTIEAGEIYTIPENKLYFFRQDENLISDISNNLIAVGNTNQFFTLLSKRLGHFFGSDTNLYTSTGKLEIANYEPEGSFFSQPTFNLADKTTWYVESILVTGESPTLDSGTTYDLAHDYVIDVTHGKITYEENYQTDIAQLLQGNLVQSPTLRSIYRIVVNVNGSEVTEDVDYTVNYADGKITFTTAPAGPVTVNYYYATTSNFYVNAPAGKIVRAGKTEVNLTKNIRMKPIIQEYQLFIGPPLNWVTLEYIVYHNVYNVIDINNNGKGYIPKIMGMDDDMIIFPFDYVRSIDIKSSENTRLKISIKNDEPFEIVSGTAGRATATFYSALEDEY